MSSRKKEERNEKIIRGLMNLPPNRRCINCNSLGPQYVCTTFWTFVCMTCSGIHREFTHRVKSVSMAKFTSQEVEALQSGGNQRARDIYLKGWDPQSQRLPNNSNAEKIREFIKYVYVDKKYAGGKSSEKPPRDVQRSRSHEEEARRASSYHSYSQSPPYDFQYEERRYGKHAPALTRKPGSDKGLYEGKFFSFLSSSHLNDHITEDGFVNEGSNPRMSDYSVSSGSDPFRSDSQSPNFQKDIGSTYGETSRDILGEELRLHIGRDEGKIPCRQRTISSGSFGSFDSNSMSFKSISSAGLVEIASEPEQSVESHHKELFAVSSFPRSSVSGNSDALDFFSSPFAPQNVTSAASISNKSQFPESTSKSSFDLCQSSSSVTAPTFSAHQSGHTLAASSLDFFSEIPPQLSMATVEEKSPEIVIPQNEGWATFDSRNTTPIGVENPSYVTIPSSDGNSEGNFDPLSLVQWASFEDSSAARPPSSSPAPFQESSQHVEGTLNAVDTQWPSFEDFSAHGPSSLTPTLWNESQQVDETTLDTTGAQSWNAFEDSTGQLPTQNTQTSTDQVETQHPSITDANMDFGVSEDLNRERIPKAAVDIEPPFSGISTHAEVQPFAVDLKSSNPFDLPYDSDMESRNKFWDMGSLQAALPNDEMPPSFAGSVTQPWFTPSPVMPYIPNGPQGALELLAGQAPTTQIPNVQTQGPVASIGGNPFA